MMLSERPLPALGLSFIPPHATVVDLELPPLLVLDAPTQTAHARRVEGARPLADDLAFWEQYEELNRLGRGCFGSVLLVRDRASSKVAAVKVVTASSSDDQCPLREPELLRAARHQHVISLLEVFQSPTTLFILQEAARTDLMSHTAAKPDGLLDETEARQHLTGLLSAVHHLHHMRIVHRDIKATNVLLSERGEAQLADFGLATCLPDDGLLTSVCGTHDYLAPEMIRCGHGEVEGYGTSVDLWGVGLLLYALLLGGNPFERNTDIETLQAILAGDIEMASPEASPQISAAARIFIRSLLETDPERRLTAKAALQVPWLADR